MLCPVTLSTEPSGHSPEALLSHTLKSNKPEWLYHTCITNEPAEGNKPQRFPHPY